MPIAVDLIHPPHRLIDIVSVKITVNTIQIDVVHLKGQVNSTIERVGFKTRRRIYTGYSYITSMLSQL